MILVPIKLLAASSSHVRGLLKLMLQDGDLALVGGDLDDLAADLGAHALDVGADLGQFLLLGGGSAWPDGQPRELRAHVRDKPLPAGTLLECDGCKYREAAEAEHIFKCGCDGKHVRTRFFPT